MRHSRSAWLAVVVVASVAAMLFARDFVSPPAHDSMNGHVIVTPDQMKWAPAPPGLPAGSMACVLDGDPGKTGPFTLRVKAPAGYAVPPHWHSVDENITVFSGKFCMGEGDKLDKTAGVALGPGSFTKMPAKMHHYAYFDEETVFQVHGMGPFDITYINPADDPRPKDAAAPGR